MPAGRPSEYKEEYCKMLIDHMSKGYSFMSFGADVSCGRTTLYEWVDKYPEFAAAKKEGEARALKFLESRAVGKIAGQKIAGFDPKMSDTAMLIFMMKTRFHKEYGEKKPELDEDEVEFNNG